MNQIRQIQTLNKRELEAGIYNPAASWHADYRDTAFINFGGLPFNLSEGDILTIFSQYGEPVFLKLARDKETGKSKGFGWLKYEDQRSCDLAVDNLGGAEIAGRLVRVDHARYKSRDDEDETEFRIGWEDLKRRERRDHGAKSESDTEEEDAQEVRRPMIKEEMELAKLIAEHDEDDPMKTFLIEEKKKEVDEALRIEGKKERKHKHRHNHRRHGSRRERDGREDRDRKRSRRDETLPADDRTRDETPEARDRNKDRDRKHRDDGHDRQRRRDHPRSDEDDNDRDRRRARDSSARHEKREDYGSGRDRRRDRDHEGDLNRRSRRRSRSRTP